MSIWAGIKHALNTTLGTTNFKPLDRQIVEQMRMIPSDTTYHSLDGYSHAFTTINTQDTVTFPQKVKMTRYGIARFKGVLERNQTKFVSATFYIYKNGAEVFKIERTTGSDETESAFSTDIAFEPNDVFTFKLSGKSTDNTYTRRMGISSFALCGTIEHNFIEFVS